MMDRDALDDAWYIIKNVTRSLENMKPYYTNWGTDVDQMLKKADEMDKKAKGNRARHRILSVELGMGVGAGERFEHRHRTTIAG